MMFNLITYSKKDSEMLDPILPVFEKAAEEARRQRFNKLLIEHLERFAPEKLMATHEPLDTLP